MSDIEVILYFTIDHEQKNMYVITKLGYIYTAPINGADLSQLNWKRCPVMIPEVSNVSFFPRPESTPLVILNSTMYFYIRGFSRVYKKQDFESNTDWELVYQKNSDETPSIDADSIYITPSKTLYLNNPHYTYSVDQGKNWQDSNNTGITITSFGPQSPTTWFNNNTKGFINTKLIIMLPSRIYSPNFDDIIYASLDGTPNKWTSISTNYRGDEIKYDQPQNVAAVFSFNQSNNNPKGQFYILFNGYITVIDYAINNDQVSLSVNRKFDINAGLGHHKDLFVDGYARLGSMAIASNANYGEFSIYEIDTKTVSKIGETIKNPYATDYGDSVVVLPCFRFINKIPVFLNWDGVLSTLVSDKWQKINIPKTQD